MEITNKTRSQGRGRAGVPRSLDVQRLAKAISGPGVDTRFWFSGGTVGTFDEETNEFKTDDPQAVYVDRLGVVADLRLEPSGKAVTARYNGVACGRAGFMLVPLRAGETLRWRVAAKTISE